MYNKDAYPGPAPAQHPLRARAIHQAHLLQTPSSRPARHDLPEHAGLEHERHRCANHDRTPHPLQTDRQLSPQRILHNRRRPVRAVDHHSPSSDRLQLATDRAL